MPKEIKANGRGFDGILKILDEMLRDNVGGYVEMGSKKVGDINIRHALRIGFLDDENSE